MKSWYEIYKERMNASYLDHVATKYAPFLEQLHRYQGELTTEIGCGAGTITRLLRQMETTFRWHFLTDKCPKMLGLAIENNPISTCNFSVSDVVCCVPANCDLVHSHGLLEHFEDDAIREIIKNMRYAAPLQLHYVPSDLYTAPSRGDERLMSIDQWREILSPFRRAKIQSFNDGYDLILRIER